MSTCFYFLAANLHSSLLRLGILVPPLLHLPSFLHCLIHSLCLILSDLILLLVLEALFFVRMSFVEAFPTFVSIPHCLRFIQCLFFLQMYSLHVQFCFFHFTAFIFFLFLHPILITLIIVLRFYIQCVFCLEVERLWVFKAIQPVFAYLTCWLLLALN